MIDEHAVMGYKYQSFIIMRKIGFQPLNCTHVQVIGGFIQQQHIGFTDQEINKRDTSLLSTRQGHHRSLEIFITKAKLRENGHPFLTIGIAP